MAVGSRSEVYKRAVCATCGQVRVCQGVIRVAGMLTFTCGPCHKRKVAAIDGQEATARLLREQWEREAGVA